MNSYKKTSVLVIQPWLNYRGAETVSYQLTEDLHSRGITAQLACLYIKPSIAQTINKKLVILPPQLFQRLFENQLFFIFFGIIGLFLLLLRRGSTYSILNPHNFPSVWCAVFASFFFHQRVVWTVHNFPQHPFRGIVGTLYEYVTYPFDRFVVNHVDLIVCVSEKVATQVHSRYGKSSQVVYPGIDTSFFKEPTVSPEAVGHALRESRFILHVGQIRTEKCQQFTLSLFERVLDRYPELYLVFIGEGDRSQLRYSDRASQHILFFEVMSKTDLRWFYRNTSLLVFPSSWGEGCSLVPLEALAAGALRLAVVRGCGVDELIEQSLIPGNVFEPDIENAHIVLTNSLSSEGESFDSSFIDRSRYADEMVTLFNLTR